MIIHHNSTPSIHSRFNRTSKESQQFFCLLGNCRCRRYQLQPEESASPVYSLLIALKFMTAERAVAIYNPAFFAPQFACSPTWLEVLTQNLELSSSKCQRLLSSSLSKRESKKKVTKSFNFFVDQQNGR